jgi:osmotically-inducible protein OsmY
VGLLFCNRRTHAQTRTMLDTSLHPVTRNSSANFTASDAEELRLPQRTSPAANSDFDGVSVEAVAQALCATGYPALRDVQIEIERGIVVLWGRVPTYHQKQLAQAAAQRVDGVRGIANGIEVVSSSQR